MNQSFPKAEKLKRKKVIDSLFTQGKSIKAHPLILVYKECELSEEHVKFQAGFSVSKRNHKTAVARNRVKRLMREAFRKNKHLIELQDKKVAVMFIYTGKNILSYLQLEQLMVRVLEKLTKEVKNLPK